MDYAFFGIDQIRRISTYSIAVEYMSLSISLLILFFMLFTRPKFNTGFILLFIGIVESIVDIILFFYLINQTDSGDVKGLTISIQVITWLVIIIFGSIMQSLSIYVTFLGHNRQRQKRYIAIASCFNQLVYLILAAILYVNGYLIEVQNNNLQIIGLIKFLTLYAILMYATSLLSSYLNRRNIARFVLTNIYIFSSVGIIILLYQLFTDKIILISASYVISFTIFYVLHHSNPVDEITGCHNISSLQTDLQLLFATRRDYAYAHFSYPQLAHSVLSETRSYRIESAVAMACNYIFKNIKNASMYRYSATDFIVVKKLPRERQKEEYDKFIATLANLQETTTSVYEELSYAKYIIMRSHENIKSIRDVKEMIAYINNYYISRYNKNELVVAEEADYKGYLLERKIIEIFEDIRENKNYKDPRIICYAQPILDVNSNKYKTAEALIRLKINGVNVPPSKFIPIAETRGYVHSLSLTMIHKVAEAINKELKDYNFDAITINISARELSDKHFAREVLTILDSYDIPYNKIRLEITESAMYEDQDVIYYNIRSLKDVGIRFYLDDYGTGYSNLDRMTDNEFSTIKFDKSIFYKAIDNKDTEEMLDAVIGLVKKRGIVTLVEGVETMSQAEFAMDKGFEHIQGYYYSRPVPIEKLVDYFDKKQ